MPEVTKLRLSLYASPVHTVCMACLKYYLSRNIGNSTGLADCVACFTTKNASVKRGTVYCTQLPANFAKSIDLTCWLLNLTLVICTGCSSQALAEGDLQLRHCWQCLLQLGHPCLACRLEVICCTSAAQRACIPLSTYLITLP